MPPLINEEKCIACGKCADICPQDVFFGSEKKKKPVISYPEECWHCNACVLDCPAEGAIKVRIPLPMQICYK
jgi:adenylylsulfate reductase subunit B